MQNRNIIPFKIQSMDSLGQGVSKETDKITFIPKTLPEEAGKAIIVGGKKGVQFATLVELETRSPHRVEPVCPHFNNCPSCHFLHTSYEEEIRFKKLNLEKLFYKIPHPPIQVLPAMRRTGYRNRLQLHYDLKAKKLGMLDAKNHRIAPIPDCLIARNKVTQKIQELYQNENWVKLLSSEPAQGHIEIYEINSEVKVSLNQAYAEGGFTQVFDEMNQELKKILFTWTKKFAPTDVLDLFAGNGNLSEEANYSKRLCVDYYQKSVTDPFTSQDLYYPKALEEIRKKIKTMGLNPATIILDPPRSGLKNLDEWLEAFAPKRVAYISCDPHTLVRDLMQIKNYKITELHLIDFFPSTFHFETMVFLERT
jgi:23S rRNA (uracil1939-C5)-methyltransferase